MKLLIDPAEHFAFLNEAVQKKPTSVFITSYGFYAGILPDGRDTAQWGDRFHSQTRDLLETMRGIKDVKILIGLYEFKSCKGKIPCADCERKYALDLIRHMNHAEKFPEFQWRIATSSHMKCVLFTYPKGKTGVAGSRNFTDSSWEDISVTLDPEGIDKLQAHINGIWEEARPLTDAAIGKVLEEQGVSDKTMASIVAGM